MVLLEKLKTVWQKLPPLWYKLFPQKPETVFVLEWTAHLAENAKVYNGLFSGLQQVSDGSAKKPKKIISEWCARTRYKFEDSAVNSICQDCLLPLVEKADEEECKKWTDLLLTAAEKAGIRMQAESALVLDDTSVLAYIDWDGEELYSGDAVQIKSPAWYQNGRVLEQGHCHKEKEERV